MLGASHAVLLGACAPGVPQTYDGVVDLLNPISHWPLATLTDRKGVSNLVAHGAHETGLPPIAQEDENGFARGFNGADAYGTIAHSAAYEVAAGGVFVLMQPDTVAAKMQVFNSGVFAPGSMALEILAGGQPRAYRHRSDGTPILATGSVGQIVAGTPYLYGFTWGPNGVRLWLMDASLSPGLVDTAAETDWTTITDTATKYLGRWSGSAIDHFDGVLGHLQFYGTELSQAQIESLALPQRVVWLGNFDAGSVAANGSTFIDFAPHAHPASGYTPVVLSQPSLGTATAVSTGADYDAGATTGNADTFTAKITAGGTDSRIATITIDVAEAAAEVNVGTLQAFTRSTINVTALSGWPSGRTPKHVLSQGTHAHGFVRRSWKPTHNDGTWMDFWPGWQPTPAGQKTTISIELDDGATLDISADVEAPIPAPSGSGQTRYLDSSAASGGNGTVGAPWNSWKTAVEGLTAGDVLVVRARAGSRQINGRSIPYTTYPIDAGSGVSATSIVNDVTIFADPDDLAAGRRPRIHMNGSQLAGFFDDPNGMWELDPDRGSSDTYRTVSSSFSAPIQSVNVWYRGSTGRVCGLYDYFHPTQGAFLNQIRDTTYAKYHPFDVGRATSYQGPGVTFSGGRYYVRLNPPHPSTICQGSAPNPPWHWGHYYPPSTNPNQVPMYFATTAGTTNANSCLRITSRSGWKIYNIDFVPGGYGIEANSTTNLQLWGCRFFGACHLEHIDTDNTNFQGKCVRAANATGLLFDRCEFYGGEPPWHTWAEGKGWPGAWGPSLRNAFAEVQDAFYKARHCHFEGFYHLVWGQGLQEPKHHHCTLLNCGAMDGLFVAGVPKSITQIIRCKMLNSTISGWAGGTATTAAMHYINNLEVRAIPGTAQYRASATIAGDCDYFPLPLEAPHGSVGSGGEPGPWFRCQNTIIATQRHRATASPTALGTGCGLSPHRNAQVCDKSKHWWAHNNIAAVYRSANGYLWSTTDSQVGGTLDSFVGWLLVNDPFSHIDYNHYFRDPNMPSTGRSGLATVYPWNGSAINCADLTSIRNNSPHEDSGTSGTPGFAATPTYPAAASEDVSLYNPATYQIGTGATPATGGNAGLSGQGMHDYDGNTQITYPGRSWRGCYVPGVPTIEQEVGPLGPMMG